jgi:hypothetical protein
MADCTRDDIRDLLPDLVHDQLGPAERARVEQHLAECADCTAELRLIGSLRAGPFATPEMSIDRIVAGVRASLAESAAASANDQAISGDSASGGVASGDMAADGVVSIEEARRRLGSGAGASGEREAPRPRRATGPAERRRPGRGVPLSWRIAAGIALVAAGAGGYALSRGDDLSLRRTMEQAAVAASEPAAPSATAPAGAGRSAAKAAAPAPATPMMASDVAGAADSNASAAAPPSTTLILGDALNELSESDMQALLQTVDDLEAMPDLEPHQLPLLASVVEGAL